MIILDTNVVSEIFKPQPSERVVAWVEALPSDTAITAVTVAELLGESGASPPGDVRPNSLTSSLQRSLRTETHTPSCRLMIKRRMPTHG